MFGTEVVEVVEITRFCTVDEGIFGDFGWKVVGRGVTGRISKFGL